MSRGEDPGRVVFGVPARAPRVGDVVHVLWPGPSIEPTVEAAIVTAVHSETRISATVFPAGGPPYARTSVPREDAAPDGVLRWRPIPTEEEAI